MTASFRNWAYDEKGDLYATAGPRLAALRKLNLVLDARFHAEVEADGVWLSLIPVDGTLGELGFSWHNTQLMMVLLEHFRELCPGLRVGENELEAAAAVTDPAEGSGWTTP